MLENLPEDARQIFWGLAAQLPVAGLGRFLFHRHEVVHGRRKFWSRQLVWEIPTAILSAIIGGGIAQALKLDGMAAQAVVGAVAWLGPRGLEHLLTTWISKGGR